MEFNSLCMGKIELPDFILDDKGNFDRQKTIQILSQNEYGQVDSSNVKINVSSTQNNSVLGAKAKLITLNFQFIKGELEHSFLVKYFIPYGVTQYPTIVNLNFEDKLPNEFCLVESIIDQKVALAYIYYQDITTDDDNFHNGLSKILCNRAVLGSAGKISVWAYALGVVGDYLVNNGYATKENLYLVGHSRLGKTALWASAQFECYKGVLANCSGCGGASIFRYTNGQNYEQIHQKFPYWFCPKFATFHKTSNLPFDQHYLLGCIAPRQIYIVSAKEDLWADTNAQYLGCEVASLIYNKSGITGLSQNNGLLDFDQMDNCGSIKFYKRSGTHYLRTDDWNFLISSITK